MRNPTPKRHMGTMCDALVEGRHVSYHCSLERGHEERNWGEPHYAVESEKSVRAWQDWYRQMHETPEADPPRLDRTTADPVAQLTAVHHRDEANNPSCGEMLPPFVPDGSTIFCIKPTGHTGAHSDGATTWMSVGQGDTFVPADREQPKALAVNCQGREMRRHAYQWTGRSKDTCAVTDGDLWCGMGEDSEVHRQAGTPMMMPTKTREGDQRLPNGTGVCVQDVIIAEMEESKRVGVERYGQTLRTFNGRKGIVDAAEEARDFFVYLTQIKVEAQATRNTLVEVVKQALDAEDPMDDVGDRYRTAFAEVAVDRVMGWVLGNPQADQFGNVDDIEDVLDEAWPRSGGRKAIIAAQAKAIGEFLGVPEMQEPPHVE